MDPESRKRRDVAFMAHKLGRSPYTVRLYARQGLLGPGVRKLGRDWTFDEKLVDDFLNGELTLKRKHKA